MTEEEARERIKNSPLAKLMEQKYQEMYEGTEKVAEGEIYGTNKSDQ